MLDFRIITFLAVCDQKSFTKAAEYLNITQPAVSQHMHALQEMWGKPLFVIEGRRFILTEAGEDLRQFVQTLQVDIKRFSQDFRDKKHGQHIYFGATLTIGEFTLPPILKGLMEKRPTRNLTMHVDNTENLLAMLDSGFLDFAFIEGAFDKKRYGYRLFSNQRFIPICSSQCLLRHPKPSLDSLLSERLLVREKGSGTRAVFEQILAERGLSTDSFRHVDEIGNLNVIKTLVGNDMGISFLYEEAAKDAIMQGQVCELPIDGWSVNREFNFVFSLHTRYESQFLAFLNECMTNIKMV
ncbi:LysR substrate-binding domain-containing protein [Pleomorphochaeta sp. DL1XJH-081]|uniref:LysR substrate-binding domain-containing protein n=1 Tax=Pleomorphochaeta sp. DL1XJH-081 TaxID=3409690 RepID=UPI003BB4F437